MPLQFFDCPECGQPCFKMCKAVDETEIECECGNNFSVCADSRPFEMCGIEPEQA